MLSLFIFFSLFFLIIPNKIKRTRSSKLTSLLRVQRPKTQTTSIEKLPRELVSNILSRLPAKELLKCKRVSKSWFDIITDPYFVTKYYALYNNQMHCRNQEEHLFVIRRPFLSNLKTYISLLSSNNVNFNDPKRHFSSSLLNPPNEFNSNNKYWSEIMGPLNGIYFLEGNPNVIMNPSLTQFKALPQSNFTSPNGSYSLTDYSGFGFDPKTNDYKVVVIKDLWLKETDERQIGHWEAELYSLNSNSWRKLETSLPLPFEIWSSSRVFTYVNNCCHWWGFVDESGRREDIVIAFDMVNEVFRKVKVPRIRESSQEDFAMLVPFVESATIGVIVCPIKGKEKLYDVWVMKDYWDEGSWVKQYSVGPTEVIHRPVGFYGSDQFLWNDKNDELVLYERESQQVKDLRVYGKCDSLRAARYMESLVSLQREHV